MARSKKISLDSIVEGALKKPLLKVQGFEYEYIDTDRESIVPEPKERNSFYDNPNNPPKEEVVHERKLVKKGNKWVWQE